MSAASALQKAIHDRLDGDAALTALIGAGGICDRLLDRQRLPVVVIEAIESRDHSTATEAGEEHFITLAAWSKADGHREAQAIAARLHALLHDADLPVTGFALVSLLHRSTRIGRERAKPFHRAELRFRAVTE